MKKRRLKDATTCRRRYEMWQFSCLLLAYSTCPLLPLRENMEGGRGDHGRKGMHHLRRTFVPHGRECEGDFFLERAEIRTFNPKFGPIPSRAPCRACNCLLLSPAPSQFRPLIAREWTLTEGELHVLPYQYVGKPDSGTNSTLWGVAPAVF